MTLRTTLNLSKTNLSLNLRRVLLNLLQRSTLDASLKRTLVTNMLCKLVKHLKSLGLSEMMERMSGLRILCLSKQTVMKLVLPLNQLIELLTLMRSTHGLFSLEHHFKQAATLHTSVCLLRTTTDSVIKFGAIFKLSILLPQSSLKSLSK